MVVDDLSIVPLREILPTEKSKSGDDFRNKLGRKNPAKTENVGFDKVYVINAEKQKMYKRLDSKYHKILKSLVDKLQNEINGNKDNFEKITKMIMQLNTEHDLSKNAIENC